MQRRRQPIQYTRHRQKQPEIKVNSLEPSFQEEDKNSRNIFNEPSYVDDELSGIPILRKFQPDDNNRVYSLPLERFRSSVIDQVVEKEDAKAEAKAEKKKTPSRSARQEESEEKWDWEAAAESMDQQEVVNES